MKTLLAALCAALFAALLLADVAVASATQRELRLFVASGTPATRSESYLVRLDRLADELATRLPAADEVARARAIHAFLHERVLRGPYEPGASDLGIALDGGPFNCVSATVLYTLLAQRCGVPAAAMSVPGHVWCRVAGSPAIDIESTSRDWFAIRAKYAGVPTARVSAAMAKHRRRTAEGRPLDEQKLLAVLHYNRGVALIEQGNLSAAAWENLQAVALDPACRPAQENLAAVAKNFAPLAAPASLFEALICREIALAR